MDTINLTNGPIESEFKGDPDFHVLFATYELPMGRMIAASKSTYCKEHQGELVIFNANVLTEKRGKIWYGDLNLTLDFDKLKNIADKLCEDLYILMEGDARFGYENRSIQTLIELARAVVKCNPKKKRNGNKNKKSVKNTKRKSSK
jgi:hypothetical protein